MSMRILPAPSSPSTPKLPVHQLASATAPSSACGSGWLEKARYVSRADAKFLYRETHVDRCYEQMGVSLATAMEPGVAVIDAGANIGMFATRAAEALGKSGRVFAAEPLPQTYAALCHNAQIHREYCTEECGLACAPITPLLFGVGDGSAASASFTFFPRASGWGTLTQLEASDAVLQDMFAFIDNALDSDSEAIAPALRMLGKALRTLSPPAYRAVSEAAVQYLLGRKERVQCAMATISDIIDNYYIKRVALLKVDVERAEMAVLKGVRREHWHLIDQAALECHAENLEAAVALLKGEAGFGAVHVAQTEELRGTSIYMVFCSRERTEKA